MPDITEQKEPTDTSLQGEATVSIRKLVEAAYAFVIPAYQRGYRWGSSEVLAFLNDICQTGSDKSEWNCIQPLVVKRRENKFEVIDGQQRLTTIYIILQFLIHGGECPEATQTKYPSVFRGTGYTLEYKTRQNSKEFLENISERSETNANENIDFSRMAQAYNTVDAYFREKNEDEIESFVKNLLDHTKFIWYEPLGDETPEELFTRLNIGKIPLSDAELIKAMLLNKSNFDGKDKEEFVQRRQIEIATEWDEMENALHDDRFWYFLFEPSDDARYSGLRLDAIFELWARADGKYKENEQHTVLNAVEKCLHTSPETEEKVVLVKEFWSKIRELYGTLRTWYDDPEIYHYVGYLQVSWRKKDAYSVVQLAELKKRWNELKEKSAFIGHLKTRIGEDVRIDDFINDVSAVLPVTMEADEKGADVSASENVSNRHHLGGDGLNLTKLCLTPKNRDRMRSILLLHNVLTYLSHVLEWRTEHKTVASTFFPFNLFKLVTWNVEHIASNAGDNLSDSDNQKPWLETLVKAPGINEEIKEKINEYLATMKLTIDKNVLRDKFEKLKKEIIGRHAEWFTWRDNKDETGNTLGDEIEKNSLMNLALLDEKTNKGYKNAVFPQKRLWILGKDSDSNSRPFILPCTRDVFTKSCESVVASMSSWTREDGINYLRDMRDIIKKFF